MTLNGCLAFVDHVGNDHVIVPFHSKIQWVGCSSCKPRSSKIGQIGMIRYRYYRTSILIHLNDRLKIILIIKKNYLLIFLYIYFSSYILHKYRFERISKKENNNIPNKRIMHYSNSILIFSKLIRYI